MKCSKENKIFAINLQMKKEISQDTVEIQAAVREYFVSSLLIILLTFLKLRQDLW